MVNSRHKMRSVSRQVEVIFQSIDIYNNSSSTLKIKMKLGFIYNRGRSFFDRSFFRYHVFCFFF